MSEGLQYKTLKGQRVTMMGLGSHGGGEATARWLVEQGAEVTITDKRSHLELAPAIKRLQELPLHYQLGSHDPRHFSECDMVVKNPAVPRSHPLLTPALCIESDISLFLARSPAPTVAITGTKGKSTTAAALAYALQQMGRSVHLGGNIGRSPLSFLGAVQKNDVVVLELSSFQLGDLRYAKRLNNAAPLPGWGPKIALITNIFPDHLNYYATMTEYLNDKAMITGSQSAEDWLIVSGEQKQLSYSDTFLMQSQARRALCIPETTPLATLSQEWLQKMNCFIYAQDKHQVVIRDGAQEYPVTIHSPLIGAHNTTNLMGALLVMHCLGVPPADSRLFSQFSGLPHRLEYIGSYRGSPIYNDSAATIPDATLASVESCPTAVHLIAGGSDKQLNLELFCTIAHQDQVAQIYLLEGTATTRLISAFEKRGINYCGPFPSLEQSVEALLARCHPPETILLSPGCASFGMFSNEFERGDRFRTLMQRYLLEETKTPPPR